MNESRDVIAGRYRLLDLIGSGGMGHVWLAWDERLSRAVAIKQLRSLVDLPEADAEMAHARAMREARITARLHHTNAVPVFDVVDHEGSPCLVMQYVPSRSLHEILAADGTLPARQVAAIGAGVGAALAAAHEAGIVHRDVKPGNVLLANDGTPLLTDFGISRAYGDATLTSTGMLAGTPAYLAPEVARGGASTPASDVFSLGSTLYAAVEGTPPFGAGENPMALLHRVASQSISPPRRAGSLARVLVWMLASAPEDRPTMEQVAKALEAVAAGAGDTLPLEVVRPGTEPELPVAGEPAADEAGGGHTVELPPEPVLGGRAQPGPEPRPGPEPGSEPRPGPEPRPTPRPEPRPAATAAAVALSGEYPAASAPAPVAGGASPSVAAEPSHATEPAGHASTRRRRAGVLLAAAAVLVLGLVVVFLVNRPLDAPAVVSPSASATEGAVPESRGATSAHTSSSTRPSSARPPATAAAPPAASRSTAPSPRPTSTAPSTSEGPASSGTASGAELAGAVRDYYSRLPEGIDAGWAQLTVRYRTTTATSRRTYERFWNAIATVQASDVTGSSPGSVVATLRYVYKDGRTYVERTAFSLVRQGGQLKIDRSTVLSSRQL
ncbi:MAG: serine/threonine-protein kinase [Terrabacter sp.]